MEHVDRGVPEGRGQEGWEGRSRAPPSSALWVLPAETLPPLPGPRACVEHSRPLAPRGFFPESTGGLVSGSTLLPVSASCFRILRT